MGPSDGPTILDARELPPENYGARRVQVQISGDARVRLVKLTANGHDPDLGVISAQHPSGAALLGGDEDDEIESEIDGKTHWWMTVKIDRELTPA